MRRRVVKRIKLGDNTETRSEQAKLWIAIGLGHHVPGEQCYVHGKAARWWKRGREQDPVCQQCHPEPTPLECESTVRRSGPRSEQRSVGAQPEG